MNLIIITKKLPYKQLNLMNVNLINESDDYTIESVYEPNDPKS